MKRLWLMAFAAIFFVQCAEKEEVKTVSIKLHYKFPDPPTKPLRVMDTRYRITYEETLPLASALPDSSGWVTFEFPFEGEGIVEIRGGEVYAPVYVREGGDLSIAFDPDSPDDRNPEGSLAPYFIYKEKAKQSNLFRFDREIFKLDGTDYEQLIFQAYDSLIAELGNSFSNESEKSFVDFQKVQLQATLRKKISDYPNYKLYYGGADEAPAALASKDSLDQVILSLSSDFLWHTDVKMAYYDIFMNIIMEEMKQLGDVGMDERITFYQEKKSEIVNSFDQPHVLEFFKALMVLEDLNSFEMEKAEVAMESFKSNFPQSLFTENLSYQSEIRARLSKGNKAPEISGSAPDEQPKSLSDYKGKVVYIDVWATWCGPCRQEFPFSKKLKTEFEAEEDVVFMYVSIDDDREDWLKYLEKDPEFLGEHLFTEGGWDSKVSENYLIDGIPRYILIDKEGRIASANASRPSSGEKIKEEIKALL